MTKPELLAILKCPISGQRLRDASPQWLAAVNGAIAEGRLYDVGQRQVDAPLEAGLITEDDALLYPVRGDIPTLIPDWAIRCGELSEK